MIFICLGTQKFEFRRVLQEVDYLVEKDIINDEVFAQTGYTKYKPKNYKFDSFLSQSDFDDKVKNCDVLITHGGVGSINTGLKYGKKIIVYPRLATYKEHVDDHQIEISTKYAELGYCLCVGEKYSLEECLRDILTFEPKYKHISGQKCIINKIMKFIEGK